MSNKLFTVGLLRDLEKQVTVGDISYSRMVEILNEKANEAIAMETTELNVRLTKVEFMENIDDVIQKSMENAREAIRLRRELEAANDLAEARLVALNELMEIIDEKVKDNEVLSAKITELEAELAQHKTPGNN